MGQHFTSHRIPERAHPLVRTLFQEMNHRKMSIKELSERSGVNKNTIKDWKIRSVPSVPNLDACLAVVGLKLTALIDIDRLANLS